MAEGLSISVLMRWGHFGQLSSAAEFLLLVHLHLEIVSFM